MLFKRSQSDEPLKKEPAGQEDNASLEKVDGETILTEAVSPNRINSPVELQVTADDSEGEVNENVVAPEENAVPVANLNGVEEIPAESVPGEADTASGEIDNIIADDENIEKLAETAFEKPRDGEKEEDLADEQDLNLFVAGEGDGDEESEESGDGNSLSNFFADDEEEINPLAGLINSLPDVQATELLQEAQNIREMLQQGRRGER